MTQIVLTVTLFFIYIYGMGCALTFFVRRPQWEDVVMRCGVGLGAFVVLGVFLNLIGIKLHWIVFLMLSLPFVLCDVLIFFRSGRHQALHACLPDRRGLLIGLLLIYCFTIYCLGPFSYPWLEDDDPWQHAASVKYIALTGNLNAESGTFQYINPYPPGYDIILAILHQTLPSLNFTLKFFNGLIIFLGLPFFYFFVKEFTKDRERALWAMFFCAVIPCYMTHFIWSYSLAITLFIPIFYCVLKAACDKRYIVPSSVLIAGLCMTQPTEPVKFFIMLALLYLSIVIVRRELSPALLIIPLCGILLSLLWYFPVYKNFQNGNMVLKTTINEFAFTNEKDVGDMAQRIFDPQSGASTRKYVARDYFFPRLKNYYNCAWGVGAALLSLAILGIVSIVSGYRRENQERRVCALTLLLWSAFTFLGLNSLTFSLPVGLTAYRFWPLFGIPVCLLAAEGYYRVKGAMKNFNAFSIIVIMTVLVTSGYPKFVTNTYRWDPGVWWESIEEVRGFFWMKSHLKPNSQVFTVARPFRMIGFDMRNDYWKKENRSLREEALYLNADVLYNQLKMHGFGYFIVSEADFSAYGKGLVDKRLKSLNASGHYRLVYMIKDSFYLYELVAHDDK